MRSHNNDVVNKLTLRYALVVVVQLVALVTTAAVVSHRVRAQLITRVCIALINICHKTASSNISSFHAASTLHLLIRSKIVLHSLRNSGVTMGWLLRLVTEGPTGGRGPDSSRVFSDYF